MTAAPLMMLTLLLPWCLLAVLSLTDGFVSVFQSPVKSSVRCGRGSAKMAAEEGYLSWLSKKVERAQRPPFVKIARARLTRDFAVLLMRTSYQVRRFIELALSLLTLSCCTSCVPLVCCGLNHELRDQVFLVEHDFVFLYWYCIPLGKTSNTGSSILVCHNS